MEHEELIRAISLAASSSCTNRHGRPHEVTLYFEHLEDAQHLHSLLLEPRGLVCEDCGEPAVMVHRAAAPATSDGRIATDTFDVMAPGVPRYYCAEHVPRS